MGRGGVVARDLDEPQRRSASELVPAIRRSLTDGQPLARVSRSIVQSPNEQATAARIRKDLSEHIEARLGRDVIRLLEVPERSVESSGSVFDVREVREDLVTGRLVTLLSVTVQLRLERLSCRIEFARPGQLPAQTCRRRREIGEGERSLQRDRSLEQISALVSKETARERLDRERMPEWIRVALQRLSDGDRGFRLIWGDPSSPISRPTQARSERTWDRKLSPSASARA